MQQDSKLAFALPHKRIVMSVQYRGDGFHGWQVQPSLRTVQGDLEAAIASFSGQKVVVHCAGRTDSGVHAISQVAHFDIQSQLPPSKWSRVLNGYLQNDVRIAASSQVSNRWHARFSALWRRYRYTIRIGNSNNAFLSPYCWNRQGQLLDIAAMQNALAMLLGRHSLQALHRSGSSRLDSWVNVQDVSCFCDGSFVIFEIQADGFLYGMVRLLAGILVSVGEHSRSLSEFNEIVSSGRRDLVKYAAPPQGLCLMGVGYASAPLPVQHQEGIRSQGFPYR
ncbi:MAG: tRNA pseudouridine(38-40) synthase TruA [Cyanobacteria bacterium J06641_5]